MDNNWNTNEQQTQNPYQNVDQNPYQNVDQNSYQNSYQNNYTPYNDAQQGGYQRYVPYQPSYAEEKEEPVKVSEFLLITLFSAFIPCVGIILLFVFAFSENEKTSKKNFCRAQLITIGIQLAVSLIFVILYGAAFAALVSSF